MLPLPLVFTMMYFMCGMLIVGWQYSQPNSKETLHKSLDEEKIPEEAKGIAIMLIALFLVIFWPLEIVSNPNNK